MTGCDRNIPYSPTISKSELYEIIEIYKPKLKAYKVDSHLEEHGYSVLHLPPYYPKCNTVEISEKLGWVTDCDI
jgi:hypothetical protein